MSSANWWLIADGILVVHLRLLPNSRSISGIRCSYIGWGSMMRKGIRSDCLSTSHAVLWISSAVLALPELAARSTGCVVVSWGWTKCLLLLVVLDETEGKRDGKEEEESSDDSDRESGSLQPASGPETWQSSELSIFTLNSVAIVDAALSINSRHNTGAAASTVSIDPCNICKGTSESEVQDNADETEEGDAPETADEKEANDRVDDCYTGNTLSGSKVVVDSQVVI